MSGLIERIVRRRRRSASRRLGPPASESSAAGERRTGGNGTASAGFLEQMRATAGTVAEPEAGVAETETGVAETETGVAETETGVAETESGLVETEAAGETPTTDIAVVDGHPSFRERGRIRRRVRYLRRLREVQLRDIGGFVVELERFDQERPDLVKAKIESAARTDAELRALELLLREPYPLRELREPGIGGACPECGAVHGSEDLFCASCGEPLREEEPVEAPDPLGHGYVYPE